jgi:hypothetical protein
MFRTVSWLDVTGSRENTQKKTRKGQEFMKPSLFANILFVDALI